MNTQKDQKAKKILKGLKKSNKNEFFLSKSKFTLNPTVLEGATLRLLQNCSQYNNGVTEPSFLQARSSLQFSFLKSSEFTLSR